MSGSFKCFVRGWGVLAFRAQGSGFVVKGLGLRVAVEGLGFVGEGWGWFGVQGLGLGFVVQEL